MKRRIVQSRLLEGEGAYLASLPLRPDIRQFFSARHPKRALKDIRKWYLEPFFWTILIQFFVDFERMRPRKRRGLNAYL